MVFSVLSLSAQKERKFIRQGNDLFNKNDFEKSEVEYRKALDKKDSSFEGGFNLGDAMYKQKKFEEALNTFQDLAAKEKNKANLGKIYHNIGNTYLSMQKLDEAIDAYKNSLRNSPDSKETKYNLEWARAQKKQQQQQQQNKDQQNKDQKNKDQQDKDKQDQQQNKDQKDQNKDQKDQQKDQQNKDQQKQNEQKDKKDQQQDQGEKKEQKGKISEDAAKRLLEALENDEKKVQDKVKKAKVKEQKAKKRKISKDW